MEDSITPPDGGNASGMNLEAGRKAIADLLGGPSEGTPPVEKQRAETPPPVDDGDEDEAPPPEATAEGQDEGDDAPAGVDEEPVRIRLADGTEVTLDDVDEWRRGHLRQSDYTRKTQELAAQRKEFEQRQAEITQKAQAYEQQIDLALNVAQQYLGEPPAKELLHSDPIGYMQQKEEYDRKLGELRQLYQMREQHTQEQAHRQFQEFETLKQREGQALLEAMPHLKDPVKLQAFQQDVVTILPKYGFDVDTLKSVYDHRVVLMLNDLTAYHKIQAAKPKVQEKAKNAAPVQHPGKRVSANEQRGREMDTVRRELRKTGSKHAAAKLIKNII